MVLKFHSQTPFVKGYLRTCIYDLSRCDYDLIPNDIFDKLQENVDHEKDLILQNCDNEELKWMNFLLKKEYIYFIPSLFKKNFKDFDLTFKASSIITNAVLDVVEYRTDLNVNILEELNCKHLAIRFFCEKPDVNKIANFLKDFLENITFNSIDVFISKSYSKQEMSVKEYKAIFEEIKTLNKLELFEASNENKENDIFIPKFICDINSFIESNKYNLYFNKKIRVSSSGEIFNGVETNAIHGKINKLSKQEVIDLIKSSKVSDLWDINKDRMDVCKDCEFRYMCLDNRVPDRRIDGTLYYKSECSYNPYIAKWSTENDFKSLIDSGIICNKKEFLIDFKKINQLNEKLWNE
jgi:hypothetical protein